MFDSLRRWLAGLGLLALLALTALPAAAQGLVNVNTASADELQTLPGIGATKAQAIIDYRTANGPFTSVEQLNDVTGIGDATMANIRDLVTVGDGSSAPAREPAAAQVDEEPTIDLSNDERVVGEPGGDYGTTLRRAVPAEPEQQADPVSASAVTGGRVNINTANEEQLMELPGIGATKARAIIDYRNTNGPFTSVEQLDNVSGIGPSTMDSIRDLVTVE